MPPRRDTRFAFPPELTQLIQQQNTLMQLLVQNQGNNNNPPPPPVDNLARFLRLKPPVFSSSTEPIVVDDWLRKIGRELTTVGCIDAEKVQPAVVSSLPILHSQSSATIGLVLLENTSGCNLRKRAKL